VLCIFRPCKHLAERSTTLGGRRQLGGIPDAVEIQRDEEWVNWGA
jgi:hypothetical protein